MRFFILLFSQLVTFFSFSQNTFYVSLIGNNNNIGTISQPFRTITKASQVAQPGDTIFVRGGIYRNSDFNDDDIWQGASAATITCQGSVNNYITFQPYANESVTFEFDGNYGVLILNSSYVTFQGFEIKGIGANITLTEAQNNWGLYQINGVTHTIVGNENLLPLPSNNQKPSYFNGRGLVANSSHHINIFDNNIHDCTSSGLRVQQSDYVNVVNNHIYNNTYWTTQGVGALTVAESQNIDNINEPKIIIERNLVHDNENRMISWNPSKSFITYVIDEGSGIFLTRNNTSYLNGKIKIANNISCNNGASGIMCHFTNNAIIANNTVYKNGANNDGFPGGIGINNTNNVVIANNIIFARPSKWAIGTTAQPNANYLLTNNIVFNENSSQLVYNNLSTGWLNVNPQFVNANSNDFKLLQNSAAINSGSSLYGEQYDYYGNPRNDTFVDIGAIEFDEALFLDDFDSKLLRLYPNPFSNILFVQTENEIENIKCFDLKGRNLTSQIVVIQEDNQNYKIDTSKLQSGIYVLFLNNIIQKILKK